MLTNRAKWAYDKGYRVVGNKILNPKGKRRKINRNSNTTNGYPRFNIWHEGKAHSVKCHQLAAWQKFGSNCVGAEIHIRHIDDDPLHFCTKNIELGTAQDNVDDKYINAMIGEWIEIVNAEAKAMEAIPF